MKINYRYLSILSWITWMGFILFLILDSLKVFGLNDIGILPSLQESSFARGMFFDIGILSTIICGWIAFGTNHKWRWVFAVLGLFVGSGAILPFLAIYFEDKYKEV